MIQLTNESNNCNEKTSCVSCVRKRKKLITKIHQTNNFSYFSNQLVSHQGWDTFNFH